MGARGNSGVITSQLFRGFGQSIKDKTEREDSFALLDQLRDATGEESWISDMMFRDTVRALTPRERRIIALRYLNGKTQTQVAKEIGISQAQVSRLEKAALNHIKEQICAN